MWRDIDDVLAASGQYLDGDLMPIYEAIRAMGIEVWPDGDPMPIYEAVRTTGTVVWLEVH
jgi:hypothetical protein